MSDFNTQDDYYEEDVQRQTRATGRRGLPLWPLVVILLLILTVFITLWNPFAPSPQPTPQIIPTVTPALPTVVTLPTATNTPTPEPTPTPSMPTEIEVGGYVKVVGAEADALSYRSGPGLNYARLTIVKDGTTLKVLEGPEEADGYTWWRLEDEDGFIGWAADDWLEPTLP
jgi:uncharacterized protein YgiM (DUF1202 family)